MLDLIDKKPSGILPLLDEEVVLPRTTDDTFLRKLGETHEKKHCRYERPRGSASRTGFAVQKFRGQPTALCLSLFALSRHTTHTTKHRQNTQPTFDG